VRPWMTVETFSRKTMANMVGTYLKCHAQMLAKVPKTPP
jgi:hypothetical protein